MPRALIAQRVPLPCVPAGLTITFLVMVLAGCDASSAFTPPPIQPGSTTSPREVNVIAKEWLFLPSTLDLVPGETVLLHVVNGGTEVHEAVFGGPEVQAAWEAAEAAVAGAPPGPTPVVSVPPEVAGVRVFVRSGERVDVIWTVPAGGPGTPGGFVVGCHIPGHQAAGMVVPVRWVGPGGLPLESSAAEPAAEPAAP